MTVKTMSEKRFERWNDHSCKVKDNYDNTLLSWKDVVNKLNEQYSFISYLLVENEEYEEESEDMQTKINVLYHEAKKHMSSTEWEKFNRGIIEREEELGIKWVKI